MSDSFFEYNNKMFYKSQVTVGHILSYKYAKRPLFTIGYTVYCDGKKTMQLVIQLLYSCT